MLRAPVLCGGGRPPHPGGAAPPPLFSSGFVHAPRAPPALYPQHLLPTLTLRWLAHYAAPVSTLLTFTLGPFPTLSSPAPAAMTAGHGNQPSFARIPLLPLFPTPAPVQSMIHALVHTTHPIHPCHTPTMHLPTPSPRKQALFPCVASCSLPQEAPTPAPPPLLLFPRTVPSLPIPNPTPTRATDEPSLCLPPSSLRPFVHPRKAGAPTAAPICLAPLSSMARGAPSLMCSVCRHTPLPSSLSPSMNALVDPQTF